MELKIINPQEDGVIKSIQWNKEEVKGWAMKIAADRKGLVFTEETIKDAKRDRADLNKLRTAIENERKRIKKECMEPYTQFEKEVKEVLAVLDEPIGVIDAQIKEVEEQKKIEKKGQVLEVYEKCIGNLKGILPFNKVFKNEYLNSNKSMKSIMEEIQALVVRVNQDMDTIEALHTKHELQIKDMYIRTLDLSAALHENTRLDEVERRIEDRKVQERALEERKAQEKASEKQTKKQESKQESMPEVKQESGTVHVRTEPVEEKVVIDFRVTATRHQLQLLKAFLVENDITYGPVPK